MMLVVRICAALQGMRGRGLHARCFTRTPQGRVGIKLATSEQVPGFTIKEYKGLVMGSTVRAKDATKDITSAIRAVFGGELPHYTELMKEAREEALARLEDEAEALGANAVISLRLSSTNIAASTSEVMAYGTAVIIE
ncbi:unnamed protein product [Effrenium voratum]|nr:unnamed protein product [Effrenium voratum]